LSLLLVVPAGSLRGQPNATQEPAAKPAAPAQTPGSQVGGVAVEDILEADEAVLEGGGYSYDPGDRRDPFKSLLSGQEARADKGPRPPGIPGLLIDEISLAGVFKTSKGFVAQVQASNKEKSYLIRVGDQLFDGDVIQIGALEVVFKQIVSDPTALKPFREVTKRLNP
jgi:Tfp pilus assembly protein PilP